MNKNKTEPWVVWMWAFIVLAFLSLIMAGLTGESGVSQSDLDELNQLQQKNYEYQAEQRRVREYIESQRERNKIEAGYYD